eukprot:15366381-Ditylum_brightwellii.AAC.1
MTAPPPPPKPSGKVPDHVLPSRTYVMEAMESGACVWAKAPGSNPGHSHTSLGGRNSGEWVGCGGLGCKWASALAICEQQELQLPVGNHEGSKARLACSRGVQGRSIK